MASTSLNAALSRQKWINDFFKEYVRDSGFKPYMNRKSSSIIVTKYELQEEAGKTINIPLITRLQDPGARGNFVLDGSEEELGNYNCQISVDWIRNGVRVPKSSQYQTEIPLLDAAKDMLTEWSAESLRTDMIKYMGGPITGTSGSSINSVPAVAVLNKDGSTVVAAATAANFNTWSAANQDRILYGAATANYSATHATGLANVDSTNDKASASILMLAKRLAKAANPKIRPFRVGDGREYYVWFLGARSFRDLKGDSTMIAANREARAREGSAMNDNPLFQDGDLIYDGVICREVPEISDVLTTSSTFATAGASSIPVEPTFLCGAQAMGLAWGQEPTPRTDRDKDYGFRPGVAIEELRGLQKLNFNGKQHGMVTVYVSGVGD